MRISTLKIVAILAAVNVLHLTTATAQTRQKDTANKLEGLGGNPEILKRAKELSPDNKIRVVQKRAVDRTWRVELGASAGMVAGGDPYVKTENLGVLLDVHINPMWSVGARYHKNYNELTPEGRRVYDASVARTNAGGDVRNTPDIDYPLETALGVLSFYPLYGKINMFNAGVAQFDLYMLGGYGQVRLSSGTAPTWTAGGGVGFWWSQHFSSRLEVRYQNYQDQLYSGTNDSRTRDIDAVVSTIAIGFLL